jgi:Winged helix DNA-binding domain
MILRRLVEPPQMVRFTVAERRARLLRRHHLALEAHSDDVVAVARDLVGLHATDPATVYLSLRARTRGVDPGTIECALYEDRALLRMIGMRRTLFVLPLELAAIVQAACTEAIARTQRRRYAKLIEEGGIAEDGEQWLDEAAEATFAALEARGQAFGNELSREVPALREKIHYGEGKTWAGSVSMTSWVLFQLAAERRVVRARPRGGWTGSQWSWVPATAWLAEPLAHHDPEAARAELAGCWLRSYGPALVEDLKWWSGWSLTHTRAALAAAGAVEVQLDGAAGVALPDDDDSTPAAEPRAVLLPGLDPTVMGWKERGWYLGAHGPALFDSAGNAGPSVWWKGRVVGGWAQRKDGEIVFRLLEDVGADATAAVEADAEQLAAWIGETQTLPRFRTPLERELTA